MSAQVTLAQYVQSLSKLSPDVDPTIDTEHSLAIKVATTELAALPVISRDSLSAWVSQNPQTAYVLGLCLGMSQERLKNTLKREFGTSSVLQLSRTRPNDLIGMLDDNFDLVALLDKQLAAPYTFGDILVARAGGKVRALTAAASGRSVEDEIEAVVKQLGLPYQTRTKFVGVRGQTAPADLVIPNGANALIVVAAKGFDSTGSKLSEAVREVQDVANVRKPIQMVCAVIDGMGWASRMGDLTQLYNMWDNDTIDGLYTLSSLSSFKADVEHQAKIRGLL